jgi:prevent-host-death family protein
MNQQQISKSTFKAKALEYFRQVEESGTSVIVTDHGTPAVEVRPFRKSERNPFDVLRGSVVKYEQPLAPVAADDWEAAQ